jgi:hypothetical protein
MFTSFIDKMIYFFDTFGFYITFRNKDYSKYRTRTGGIATILVYIASIYFFIYKIKDVLNLSNAKERVALVYNENSEVKSPDFIFALYFSDYNMNDLKFKNNTKLEDYFEFYADLKTNKINKTTIEFIKCNNLTGNSTSILENNRFFRNKINRLNNTFCLNLKNFSLRGSLGEIPNKSLSIYVKKKLENSGKKLNKIFYKFVLIILNYQIEGLEENKFFYIHSFFINSFYKTFKEEGDENYTPNNLVLKQYSIPIDIDRKSTYKLFITYRNSETNTDTGKIFPDIRTIKYPKISNYVPDEVPYEDKLIYNAEIDADHYEISTFTTFIKIQDCIAATGGFITIMKLVLLLIFDFFNKYKLSFMIFGDTYLGTNIVEFENNKEILDINTRIKIFNQKKEEISKAKQMMGLEQKSLFFDKDKNNDSNYFKCNESILNSKNNEISLKSKSKINSQINDKSDICELSDIIVKSESIDIEVENEEIIIEPKNSISPYTIKMANYLSNNEKYFNNNDRISNNSLPSSSRNFKTLELKEFNRRFIDGINPENTEKIKEFISYKDIESNGSIKEQKTGKRKTNLVNSLKVIKDPKNSIEKSSLINFKLNEDKSDLRQNQQDNNQNIFIQKPNENQNIIPNLNLIDENNFNKKLNDEFEFDKIIKKKENTIENIIEDKIKFKLNLSTFIKSKICCMMNKGERKIKMDSYEIILEKIKNEMEIKSYLKMREDFVLLKEIFLGKNYENCFKTRYSFEEIYYGVTRFNENYSSFNHIGKKKSYKKTERRSKKIHSIKQVLKLNKKLDK